MPELSRHKIVLSITKVFAILIVAQGLRRKMQGKESFSVIRKNSTSND
jgi:hypothetical protein